MTESLYEEDSENQYKVKSLLGGGLDINQWMDMASAKTGVPQKCGFVTSDVNGISCSSTRKKITAIPY